MLVYSFFFFIIIIINIAISGHSKGESGSKGGQIGRFIFECSLSTAQLLASCGEGQILPPTLTNTTPCAAKMECRNVTSNPVRYNVGGYTENIIVIHQENNCIGRNLFIAQR